MCDSKKSMFWKYAANLKKHCLAEVQFLLQNFNTTFGRTLLEGFLWKSIFIIKKQEASGLLSSLGIRTPLRKFQLVGNILFYRYKMNEIINKIL